MVRDSWGEAVTLTVWHYHADSFGPISTTLHEDDDDDHNDGYFCHLP